MKRIWRWGKSDVFCKSFPIAPNSTSSLCCWHFELCIMPWKVISCNQELPSWLQWPAVISWPRVTIDMSHLCHQLWMSGRQFAMHSIPLLMNVKQESVLTIRTASLIYSLKPHYCCEFPVSTLESVRLSISKWRKDIKLKPFILYIVIWQKKISLNFRLT